MPFLFVYRILMGIHRVGPDFSHRCRVLDERANNYKKTSREACGVLGDQRLGLKGHAVKFTA